MDLQVTNENNSSKTIKIDKIPDKCPICGYFNAPYQHTAFQNSNLRIFDAENELQIVFRCTNSDCRYLFIAYYRCTINSNSGNEIFLLTKTKPNSQQKKEFDQILRDISGDFIKIYNEAYHAEQLDLKNICGGGYRKALEFLIKDYLIKKEKEDEVKEDIKKEFLGDCIKNRISDSNIKSVAKRAVWLGNDEIHYVKKWENKDLQDLKKLIDLTTHWIISEAITESFLKEMPEPKTINS
ncbi:MAG: DUF4145 domain-containing protein [Candidatus Pacebacteria bacterium]|nr:DUF4145 domain-containing protein [Candidatus Paceibacterota bacterium]